MSDRFQSTASIILAALVTTIVATIFDLAGVAISAGDYSGLISSASAMIPAAVIFGAPFAVPIALMIRLRNTWRAVPFIAVAAAFGIELQMELGRLLEGSAISGVLMMVWIVPAIFGTVAALLFRWHERTSSLTIAAIASVSLIVFAITGANSARELAPAHKAAESWSKLHSGMSVFAGDDGNASGLTVCPTLAKLLNSDRPSAGCRRVARGAPAVVDEILPCQRTDPAWGFESPHVRLHAADGSWSGYSSAAALQPSIPIGTLIEMQRDWGAPLSIYNERAGRTNIGATAMVRLLRYDPTKSESLYVKILDGAYRDRVGWMGIQNADTGGVALGEYSLQYEFKACMNE